MKRIAVVLVVCLACFVFGFWLGRSRQTVHTEVRYEAGEKKTGHYGAPDLVPVRTELQGLSDIPTVPTVAWRDGRTDTLWREPDTAAIMRDYALLRHYSELLFDNADGKLEIRAGTQYNRLAYLDYIFTPVQRVESEVRERLWMPFVSVGYGTNKSVSVGGGVFYRHIGAEYEYNFPLNGGKGWHSFEVKYRW